MIPNMQVGKPKASKASLLTSQTCNLTRVYLAPKGGYLGEQEITLTNVRKCFPLRL